VAVLHEEALGDAAQAGEAEALIEVEGMDVGGHNGIEKVQVMLTLDPAETKSSFGTGEADDADGIRAVRGVIVAAEGAANVSVRMNIISAVSTALGIDRHLVEVFVMAG
ncbi:MAG: hypothetical protein II072_09875, partial [Clostridia bacterium]|nr:hypothetical protein [Clostridia bacterium]